MAPSPLPRLRKICLALPGATEVEAWGTSTFRCGKIFGMFSHASDHHHSGGRYGVWLKAGPGNQELMVRDDPDRFFVPPYVGPAGWIGVRLDKDPPWDEIALLIEDAWRLIAPKKILKQRDEGAPTTGAVVVSKSAASKRAGAKRAAAKPAKRETAKSKAAKSRTATKARTPAAPRRRNKK